MAFLTRNELDAKGFLSLGDDVKVSTRATLYGVSRIALGSHVRIDDFCVLSAGEGGITIGNHVHIAVMATLIGKGRIVLNDFCNISGRVSIYSSSDDYSGESLTNPTIPDEYKKVDHRDVVLEKHVIVGAGSVILPGVTIHEGAAVGALSLVTKDLDAFGIYSGVPAKRIKERKRDLLDLERRFLSSKTGA
ncbi:dTDP-4-amino-4,6-dideoxy-D-glucose acyltransferase [Methylococcus capsulatus]|uniref:Chloramphenicol acetyltransferase n=2 Tax=Methylococcus capsulatus TaxID=414 RepID=A0AA35UMG8_METCP|nr:dTDP-4-amino-4,6-dideoxy-D-glucose acyltransferase [Methylococcus capsulatus]